MDTIMFYIFVTWAILVIAWVCYMVLTNKVIKQQEKEIDALKAEIQRQRKRRILK